MMKFLALVLYLVARITLTLTSSSPVTGCFGKVNFREFSLVIRNFEPPAFLSVSCKLFEKQSALCENIEFQ